MSFSGSKPAILFLGPQIATGGAQQVLFLQAHWFYKRGYPVQVAFFYDREGLYSHWQAECPFPIINLGAWSKGYNPFKGWQLLRGFSKLYTLLLQEEIAIVETFTHHANMLGLPVAYAARVPVRIASHHNLPDNFPGWARPIHRWIINRGIATGMVAVSQHMRQQAVDKEGIYSDKIRVIHNGIDPDTLIKPDANAQAALRQSLGIAPDNYVALTVGRLIPVKGHTYLLRAWPEVLKLFPKTVLILAGDGPLRQILEAQTYETGIQDSVRFLGTRSDISALLSIADLFVMPSLDEGLSIALLEAMLMGLPVVATQIPGAEEVITDGQHGWLVPPADSMALSTAIVQLLANPSLRENQGKAGASRVREGYTVDRMCQQYEALFQATLVQSKREKM